MVSNVTKPPYNRCVMGGTFDRLHKAHEVLLQTAAHMAKQVFVGIVSDELGKKLFPQKELGDIIQPYSVRVKGVKTFLEQYTENVEIEPLYDAWGPAPTDPHADLIVVSYETEKNAQRINKMRKENQLEPLDIIVIPNIYVENKMISSTLLRKRESKKS